ncbi:hypothetical protein LEM8419_02985 [Neolewinella maritima]|uniref:VCBS repeat-containing protein n=1 Tax=Neolewinella maritima TaxID=1383882 RepID=A0ABN8FCR2_9BACT|nr:VCBS repeat-containing protein [Neolewinella maritima]CAH1002068.1 hypothetical protein LEM8419_02985 [Neolewinella maritima]
MRWTLAICALPVLLLCTCGPAPEDAPRFAERLDTGVNSVNQLLPTEDFNIIEYLYYYNGGGVAATDISGDGLPDLYFTNNQGPNKYYINEGDWHFRDATELDGVAGAMNWSTGVSVEDVSGDGLPDIYVCNVGGYKQLTGRNELFVQQPDGTFLEQAADYGLAFTGFNTQAYWFDYDLDGDQDMYLLRHSVHNDASYGEARSREVTDDLAGDKLLCNDGGTFVDVTAAMGLYSSKIGYGLSAAVADFDGNGYPDIYVCNDFSENDYLYLNLEGEGFKESIRERTGHTSNFSMGSDVGDLDRDGRPDLVTLDMRPGDEQVLKSTASADAYNVYRIKRRAGYYDQLPRNNVQWNRGGGHFSDIAELAGLAATDWSWSVLLEDFDLDGRQEVFVANGIERRPNDLDYLKFVSSSLARESSNLAVISEMPTGYVANQMFVEKAPLTYAEADWGLGAVGSSTGAAVADFDRDGDMDLVVNNVNAPAQLYENRTIDGSGVVDSLPTAAVAGVMVGLPQRGFMSQSERGALGSVGRGEVVRDEVSYRVEVLDTIELADDRGDSFDRQPLLPYAGAEDETPLVYLSDSLVLETGLWRPVTVRQLGADGVWSTQEIANSTGWWQSISRSGPRNFVLGNWGLNSTLGQPSPDAPLRRYREDVDDNGRIDPLITYVRGGREYSLADKDDLTRQFPSWRRNNLSYGAFSRRSFGENFPDLRDEPQRAVTLAHWQLRVGADGEVELQDLPTAAQSTTLNVVEPTPMGLLLGGNKLDVLPRIGRQDAAALQLLHPDGAVQFIDLGAERNRAEVLRIERIDTRKYSVLLHTGELVGVSF